MAVAALLGAAEIFAAASPGCGAAQVRDGGALTVSAAGHERRALVRVPQSYDGKTPRPVAINLICVWKIESKSQFIMASASGLGPSRMKSSPALL